jgi:electron transfer flavoprotein alpha subunit
MKNRAEELLQYGADKVYYFDGEPLAQFHDDTYGTLVADFINQRPNRRFFLPVQRPSGVLLSLKSPQKYTAA